MYKPEYLEKGRVMEERQNIDPTFDEAVNAYSETTGVNQEVQISGLGMSNCNSTSECPREVKSRVQSQLSCEVVRVTVVQDQGECRVPGAGTAMQPCNQNLMERGISREHGECRAPGAGTAMRPYQQNLMEREVSKEDGKWGAPDTEEALRPYHYDLRENRNSRELLSTSATGGLILMGGVEATKENSNPTLPESRTEEPELRLNCELSVLGAEWQKLARAPTLQLKLVSWKLKFRLSWNYEVNMFGLTVQKRCRDPNLPGKSRGNYDTNRMVRRKDTMEEKDYTRKKSRPPRWVQGDSGKQPDDGGNSQMENSKELEKTGIGGVQSLPFWELIRERLGSLLYITYVWKACRINMTRCGKHESVDFGGSAELERTTHQAEREWAPPTISCS